jgi:hypothetical protein
MLVLEWSGKMQTAFVKMAPRWRVYLSIASVIFLCSPTLPAGAKPDGSEWILEQKHQDLGNLDLYVCHDAIKIVNQQWGYQLLAKAPGWSVHCFRPDDKTEWVGELDQFNGPAMINPMAPTTKITDHFGAFGKGKINGLRYTKYAPTAGSIGAIYGADDVPIAAQAAELICRYYNIADTGKLPLYRSNYRGKGQQAPAIKKNLWLNMDYGRDLRGGLIVSFVTQSGKQVPFNSADFDYPKGYARRPLTQVAYSSQQKDTLNDVINNIGFASEHAPAKKKLPLQTQTTPAPAK